MHARRILLELLDAALRAVDGRGAVAARLHPVAGRYVVFAVGKAASAMALGAHDVLDGWIESTLVITKDGHVDPALTGRDDVTVLECAHPVPDERSLAAGACLVRRLAEIGPDTQPLFLVSGGSSSLVESLREGVSLEELRALNERGLASGIDIRELNALRARLSKLKSGGVARLLRGRPAIAMFLSDVPGDDPDVIGSGLLGSDGAYPDQVRRIVVASVDTAVRQVVQTAANHGLTLAALPGRFAGDSAAVANEFLGALRDTQADGIVWGGESTVRLAANPGRGGRNSHLALTLARQLGREEPLLLLAAATDGTDGPTQDAGAIVDAATVERAELAGCDVDRAFDACDSGTALEASGDLVHTGPTGTNVGDLLVGLRISANSLRGGGTPRVL